MRQAAIVGIIIFAIVASILFGYYMMQAMYQITKPVEYSENLKVYFRVINGTTGQAITSGIVAELYTTDVNPMARQAAERGDPIATAVYDSQAGAWSIAGIDAGTYKLLIYYGQNTYPALVEVTANPTTDPDREQWFDPGVIYLYARATITVSRSAEAFDESTNSWVSVSDLNTTTYDKWRITYTIKVSGADKTKIKAPIRFYFDDIDGFSITECKYDGTLKTLKSDEETSSDALKGLYFEVTTDMEPGDIHTIVITIEETGTVTATSFTFTMADFYTCQYTTLKFWTYTTDTISITS